MKEKPPANLWGVRLVPIMSDGDIRLLEQLVKFGDKASITCRLSIITWEVREPNEAHSFVAKPFICKRKKI